MLDYQDFCTTIPVCHFAKQQEGKCDNHLEALVVFFVPSYPPKPFWNNSCCCMYVLYEVGHLWELLKGMMVKIRYWFFLLSKLPTEMFFQANWIRIEIELDLCCFLLFDAITLYGNGFFFRFSLFDNKKRNWSSFISFFFVFS